MRPPGSRVSSCPKVDTFDMVPAIELKPCLGDVLSDVVLYKTKSRNISK